MIIFEDDIKPNYYIKDSYGNKIWISQDTLDKVFRDKDYQIYYCMEGEIIIMDKHKIVKITKKLIDEIMVESL